MPKTESHPVTLGFRAPDFSLPGPTGQEVALADFADRPALLVAFISNRCPFVLLLREAFAAFANEYAEKGLAVIAINSNDPVAHPEEALERLGIEAQEQGYRFPYLKDASQEVAKAYQAACTPDLFLFDGERRLVYHGQFDDARPGNGRPVMGADLRAAADAVLRGDPPLAHQVPSIGCNIKWAENNAPASISAAA